MCVGLIVAKKIIASTPICGTLFDSFIKGSPDVQIFPYVEGKMLKIVNNEVIEKDNSASFMRVGPIISRYLIITFIQFFR